MQTHTHSLLNKNRQIYTRTHIQTNTNLSETIIHIYRNLLYVRIQESRANKKREQTTTQRERKKEHENIVLLMKIMLRVAKHAILLPS